MSNVIDEQQKEDINVTIEFFKKISESVVGGVK